MRWPIITKPGGEWRVRPNLLDYAATRAAFSWKSARQSELAGLPDGKGLNIAHEAVDRHAFGARAKHVALRFLARDATMRDVTFHELRDQSSRFANVLRDLGVPPGAKVFVLAGRMPELYFAALGTMKQRCIFSPLFSAFGPEPIQARLRLGEGRVLVTTPALYRRKMAAIRNTLPSLEHVLLTGAPAETETIPGTRSLAALMSAASAEFTIEPTAADEIALLHFTSGTTGQPKGALHVHGAVLAHHVTAKYALDFHPNDIFWCTADPGWVTGTSYGIIAPLTHGLTSIVDEADFDAERWYRILQDQHVSVWYTAPTALRMLMRAGAELPRKYDLRALRFIASVGEPLNPEAVVWGRDALGLPIHDNWWQTETGGIMIANYAALDIRPGSMGLPLPGIDAAIVQVDEAGGVRVVTEPDVQGELALRPGWPSMFRGYLNDEERYRKCFAGDWYLTSDLARQDADGSFW
ncbi:MAG TPA: AMP-binding protein, partial [Longimicrobiales bacterium]|nr:AMP-binding protein [Longimicrobiales bacterium]